MSVLTSCGSEETKSNDTTAAVTTATSTTAEDENESVFPKALDDVEAVEVPSISGTKWQFNGGITDGVELEDADIATVLAQFGGILNFEFTGVATVNMIDGEGTNAGQYEIIQDNYILHIDFDNYEYYGVFTQVDGSYVLIMSNVNTPETALYCTQA